MITKVTASTSQRVISLLQTAVALHQAGEIDKAHTIYLQVLGLDSANANALNLLGTIASGRNRLAEAKTYHERAINASPRMSDAHFNLGIVLSAMGNRSGALIAYRRATEIRSDFSDAYLNTGVLLQQDGRTEEAIEAFRVVVALAPTDARAHYNLGECYSKLARTDAAEASLMTAIALHSSYREARLALATLYARAGRVSEAIVQTRALIALNPMAEYYSNLGDLLKRAGELEQALDAHRTAVAEKPHDPIILHNFGSALYSARHLDEAQAVFERALAADPKFIKGYAGLAKIYEHRGAFEVAVELLHKALDLDPNSAETVFKLSYCYLVIGRFSEGWRNYEYRFVGAERRQRKRSEPPTYWMGEDLAGKTILIWAEQGIGDQILYASMFSDVLARAKHCVIECTPRMVPIFARSFPTATVTSYLAQDEAATPAAGIDFQSAAASLGQYLRPNFESFPHQLQFLKADAERVATLRSRYRAIAPGNLVVGLSWRSKNVDIGEIKSAPLKLWKDILSVPGVTFVNLQYGDCAAEIAEIRQTSGIEIIHDPEIDPLQNMDDFFAQVAAVDLVISTSNTTVHVAGSLGVPTWLLLLGSPADLWYWFRDRADSPWYASLRILRRTLMPGVEAAPEVLWGDGLQLIARDLRERVAANSKSPKTLQT